MSWKTSRLNLRRFHREDATHLYELDGDPQVMRYINGGVASSRNQINKQILPLFMSFDHALFGFWAVEKQDNDEFLGWLSFRPSAADPAIVEIGYRLKKAAWRHGYATEGARLLIDQGFSEHGVQGITATTYEENLPSRRVMEKLGMSLTRTFRLTPEDLDAADTSVTSPEDLWDGDDVEYGITLAEWQADRRSQS